jgi:hypothetical protein
MTSDLQDMDREVNIVFDVIGGTHFRSWLAKPFAGLALLVFVLVVAPLCFMAEKISGIKN